MNVPVTDFPLTASRSVTREPGIETPWGSLKGDFAEIELAGWKVFHAAWASYHLEQRAELER